MADKESTSVLLNEQTIAFNTIKRLFTNLKKKGVANFTESYLQGRLDALNKYMSDANKNHAIILSKVNEEVRGTLPYFMENIIDQIYELFDQVEEYISEHKSVLTTERENSIRHSSPVMRSQIESQNSNSPVQIRLPILNVPKFSGDYSEWSNFRDMFTTIIHENPSLNAVQKLQYLKTCLQGEASGVIKNLAISSENYETAWASVRERFENKKIIKKTLLNQLKSLPNVSRNALANLKLMRNTYKQVIDSFENLNCSTSNWDPLMISMLIQKFDHSLELEWEEKTSEENDYPTLDTFDRFLLSKIRTLESMSLQDTLKKNSRSFDGESNKRTKTCNTSVTTNSSNCVMCSEAHRLYYCPKFQAMTVWERNSFRKGKGLCANCLNIGHDTRNCTSKSRCKSCAKPHHTMIHFENGISRSNANPNVTTLSSKITDAAVNTPADQQVNSHLNSAGLKPVLLATARVRLVAPCGRSVVVRALLDIGSESSFVSETIAQTLRLPRARTEVRVAGLGGKTSASLSQIASFRIVPTFPSDSTVDVRAFVMRKITSYAPKRYDFARFEELSHLRLSDPDSTRDDRIELLLGADVYGQIITGHIIRVRNTKLVVQNTIFGWVISGPVEEHEPIKITTVQHSNIEVSEQLQQFWQVEEVPAVTAASEEDELCETHFRQTFRRDASGRFIVRLPFKSSAAKASLGSSKQTAVASLIRLEDRLNRNSDLKSKYEEFLSEYEILGHMSLIDESHDVNNSRVYLPHHGVIRMQSSTTKVRVVFNGSNKTTSGISLNEVLCTGPKLQNDVVSVLINWRFSRYVLTADIEKMFRQILVAPEDRAFQCIAWRNPETRRISTYELNTVTYGTAPAPFLSMRVIKQLVEEHGNEYPLAVEPLTHQIYVDDILFGADDKNLLKLIRSQIIALLERGQLNLRKWSSNAPDLLENEDHNNNSVDIENQDANCDQKILGIAWSPNSDTFIVKSKNSFTDNCTKRTILSDIAKLFDPLGWFSPIVIRAKIILQELWLAKLEWDDPIPNQLKNRWRKLCEELPGLESASIPRWIKFGSHTSAIELLGFSDASQSAYSAAVYLRVVDFDGAINTSLLIAKSKVAPIKTLSIPRLELCGAVLLTKLICYVKTHLLQGPKLVRCYTDSKIVLAWLAKHPSNWQTYVANRISFILTNLPEVCWYHVPSKDNPADLNSRGLSVKEIIESQLWWQGPEWLRTELQVHTTPPEDTTVELKTKVLNTLHVSEDKLELIEKYSSWAKLLRVTAFLFKFIAKLRRPQMPLSQANPYTLDHDFIERAKVYLITSIQMREFAHEIKCMRDNVALPASSVLSPLSPFLDDQGLIRVGGRLEFSNLKYGQKHPIVLPNHRLATLIIRHTHLKVLHGGLQLTLKTLRDTYWVINARSVTKRVIRECVVCTRHKAQLASQWMSPLPPERCTPSRTFSHVGIDYAGPFAVRNAAGRGQKSMKTYLALFVCLSTRAIHLEVVTRYSTDAFIAALNRFISRRGIPDTIYSDNGTNFQGANSELRRAFKSALRDPDVQNSLAVDQVKWCFIPPAAPHYGGIWESGVRVVKAHLKRVIGSFTPTLEEFITIACRIEACLNSRPLTKLHDDPEDLQVLTPGHFLIGCSLKTLPEPSMLDLNENRLSRWQAISRVVQSFWKIWSGEYLHSLQTRTKWRTQMANLQTGDLVIIRDPNNPPAKWSLGRVLETIKSRDGLTRVVKLKTATTQLMRPITQLCKLPLENPSFNAE